MDAQTIRRALADFFKFNPKDFTVRGSPTGYLVSANARAAASTQVVNCQFQPSIVDVDGTPNVELRWGIVSNQQPTGFSAGGLPPYQVPAADGQFFYAASSVDSSTLMWNSSWIETSFDSNLLNTDSIAYRLLFSVAENDDGGFDISPYVCGPVIFDVCELVI